MMTRQELIYYPDPIEIGDGGRRVLLDVPKQPTRLFTLVEHRDPEQKPALPIDTLPRVVWQEDIGHDWSWRDGKLRYHTMTTGGRVWLLLEYDEQPTRLTTDDLNAMRIGSVVYVASVLVPRVPYKRTRKGWQTFSPGSGRANGKPLTSEAIAERGAWAR